MRSSTAGGWCVGGVAGLGGGGVGGIFDGGESEGEASALSGSVAFGPDAAAMGFDDALADGEAEAGAGRAVIVPVG